MTSDNWAAQLLRSEPSVALRRTVGWDRLAHDWRTARTWAPRSRPWQGLSGWARSASASQRTLPDVLSIGPMKSGTSSLYHCPT